MFSLVTLYTRPWTTMYLKLGNLLWFSCVAYKRNKGNTHVPVTQLTAHCFEKKVPLNIPCIKIFAGRSNSLLWSNMIHVHQGEVLFPGNLQFHCHREKSYDRSSFCFEHIVSIQMRKPTAMEMLQLSARLMLNTIKVQPKCHGRTTTLSSVWTQIYTVCGWYYKLSDIL